MDHSGKELVNFICYSFKFSGMLNYVDTKLVVQCICAELSKDSC